MSYNFSRRELSVYAVNQLTCGQTPQRLARHLAAALISSGKGKDADLLIDDFMAELERRELLTGLTISSANKLSAEPKKYLVQYVKQTTGAKEVLVSEKVDSALLGGFKLETANRSWDKTIKRQLADIREVI